MINIMSTLTKILLTTLVAASTALAIPLAQPQQQPVQSTNTISLVQTFHTLPPTTNPSSLIYLANYTIDSTDTNINGYVFIKNVAFNKVVQVTYSDENGGFGTSGAGSMDGGYLGGVGVSGFEGWEVWGFQGNRGTNGAGWSGCQFYLRFDVTDYDSGFGGSNYKVVDTADSSSMINPNIPNGANVQLQSYTFNQSTGFAANVWIHDLAYSKTVHIIYSNSNGDFSLGGGTLIAQYSSSVDNGYQIWSVQNINLANGDGGVGSSFYIRYDLSDYDSNNGNNYQIPALPTPTITTTSTSATPTSPPTTSPTSNIQLQSYTFDTSRGLLTASLYVKNLAYNKMIQLFYSNPSGDFSWGLSAQASYIKSIENNYEIWGLTSPIVDGGNGTVFYLQMNVDDYDGGANGAGYIISNGNVDVTDSVSGVKGNLGGMKSYSFDASVSRFSGEVYVKNVAYGKNVVLYYSNVNGDYSGGNFLVGQYQSSVDGTNGGFEVWKFVGELIGGAGVGSKFYIKFSIIDYDTANGNNYAIVAGPSVPPTTTTTTTTTGPTPTSTPTTIPHIPSTYTENIQPRTPPSNTTDLRLQQFTYNIKTKLVSGTIWINENSNLINVSQLNITFACINPSISPIPTITPLKGTYSKSKNNQHYGKYSFDNVPCGSENNTSILVPQFYIEIHTATTTLGDYNGGYNYRLYQFGSVPSGRDNVNLNVPEGWQGRNIYQVLIDRFDNGGEVACADLNDYCGGGFQGLTKGLDYVQGMGFDAIWISPVVENSMKGYHGYWPLRHYVINSHFGTAQDLKDLITEAHSRKIYVMLDVVANHMGSYPNQSYVNLTSYPPPFGNLSDYHYQNCVVGSGSSQFQLETCRLNYNLPDLNTENPDTVTKLYDWVHWIVNEFGFDGLRIDTAKHVRKTFWPGFIAAANNVFSIGEVYSGDTAYVGGYQPSITSVLNYPAYYNVIRNVFENQQTMWNIDQQLAANKAFYENPSILGNFIENHDQPRFLSTKNDTTLLRNAIAYNTFTNGIPIFYYGTEQSFNGGNDPNDREPLWTTGFTKSPKDSLYQFISVLNRARRDLLVPSVGAVAATSSHVTLLTKFNVHVFSQGFGKVVVAVTNVGKGAADFTVSVKGGKGYGGRVLRNLVRPWETVVADQDGVFQVTFQKGEPEILF
ncbi:hypothetical protein HDU76_013092 [Blyttiomyces sp. JEL0837]|nr:hypothetical protein HDU76_013092 [Blyttiomyces sp. JEL0837]